jgi:heat shock protein 5
MKNIIEDKQKLAKEVSDEDKTTIKNAVKKVEDWLSLSHNAKKEDYNQQLKQI